MTAACSSSVSWPPLPTMRCTVDCHPDSLFFALCTRPRLWHTVHRCASKSSPFSAAGGGSVGGGGSGVSGRHAGRRRLLDRRGTLGLRRGAANGSPCQHDGQAYDGQSLGHSVTHFLTCCLSRGRRGPAFASSRPRAQMSSARRACTCSVRSFSSGCFTSGPACSAGTCSS